MLTRRVVLMGGILLALPLTGVCGVALAEDIRVVTLNTGAGQRSYFGDSDDGCMHYGATNAEDISIVGVRRLLGAQAAGAWSSGVDEIVFVLQELDVNTSRNPGWDMPWYFHTQLESYSTTNGWTSWSGDWERKFAPAMAYCSSGPDRCRRYGFAVETDPLCSSCAGEFGIATISSTPFLAADARGLQWYVADSSFDSSGNLFDDTEYGDEPRVVLATKINAGTTQLWIVNVHLGGYGRAGDEDERIAQRQVWQVLGFAGTMDPDVPILIIGDFNILKGGLHHTDTAYYSNNDSEYYSIYNTLVGAGFSELGYFDPTIGCWNTGIAACSLNSWFAYSRVDYAFLLDPSGKVSTATLSMVDPVVDPSCYVTDHRGLSIDLTVN